MIIKESNNTHISSIAACFMLCFPHSFAVLLGRKTVAKSLEWFLQNENRFLVHAEINGEVIGFVGGFAPQFVGDGSKSGMLRHSFSTALFSMISKPSLFFHEEVRKYLPAFIRNVFLRIRKPKKSSQATPKNYFENVLISTIGIHPSYRGKGFAQTLLSTVETYGAKYNRGQMHLSVKNINTQAIRAYTKAGWAFTGEFKDTYHFEKKINPIII